MRRDSLYGEPILWEGSPREIRVSSTLQMGGWLCFGIAVVAMAFAMVRGLVLGSGAGEPLLFAVWSGTAGAGCFLLPIWWNRSAKYVVTESQVICRRGILRRAMDRTTISFARIRWSPRLPNVGTLELVRAVPTGALFRCITIELVGIEHPDAVWAIIRNAHDVVRAGHAELPLAQRLDSDERILWAARPLPSLRSYLPVRPTDWVVFASMLGLFGIAAWLTIRGITLMERMAGAGMPVHSVPFSALGVGLGLGVALVLGLVAYLAHSTLGRRAFGLRQTRYLISNKRVLIQRGREELHLDRRRIVDVIDTPAGSGTFNLFLVLDGPLARAVAAHGAFAGSQPSEALRPVFECVQDCEGAVGVLARTASLPPPKWPNAA